MGAAATTTTVQDQGGQVRSGEELKLAAVDAWLKQTLAASGHSVQGTPEVTQFAGGASNWTYRLKYAGGDVANGDFILRRPPAGTKAKGAHDMGREYRVQKALKPAYPVVPDMIGLCTDEAVTGSEFYVMARIPGVIPRKNMPRGLQLDAATTRQLCTNVLDQLVALHRVDPQGSAELAALGKGEGYCRRQIEGWSERYRKARTWNTPRYERVMAWLKERTPKDVANVVIHNDWRFDNVVLHEADLTRVIGVLDWEMATLGDPLMDLGNALAYWIHDDDNALMKATRRQPTHLPGMLRRDEVVAYYLDQTGLQLDVRRDWPFYEVYGLFRLAVIAQQIYFRYHHGQTRNPAFKRFWVLVNYLDWRCRAIIRRAGG